MHRESVHRALRVVLCTALLVSWAPSSHAVDGMLYARAIGDPYSSRPAVEAPPPARAADRGIPELPALGTAPRTDTTPTAAPVSEGWSWKRILVGVGVVVAISALASKGGGGSGGPDNSPAAPPSSGGGSSGDVSGGGGGGGVASPTPAPVPAPTPAPSPTPPSSGGGGGDDDDDDDDDKKKGKGRRILLPSFSASF